MTALLRYDEACRAVAEARTVDEAKDIHDKAEAVRVYARQAKNRDLEIDAAEIRFRAERRIGELKLDLRQTGQLHEGGRPKKTSDNVQEVSKIRLIDLGVDERLSARSERLAQIEPNSFDRLLARWRAHQEQTTDRVSVSILKEEDQAKRRADHETRALDGGKVENLSDLVKQGRRFSTILADPPWHFMARSKKGEGRSASQHYVTDIGNAMFGLPVAQLAADNCVLFMWMMDWEPQLALDCIKAWGFAHKTTAFTWVKEYNGKPGFFMGQGYWTRANPEQCWLATKGSPTRLHADVRQLLVAPIQEHSRKPDEIHARIERLVAGPYLELYARREREGWQTWGNELPFRLADGTPFDPATGEILDAADGAGEAEAVGTGKDNADPVPAASQDSTLSDADGTQGQRNAGGEDVTAHEIGQNPRGGAGEKLNAVIDDPAPTSNVSPLPREIPFGDDDDGLDIPNFLKRGHPDCIVKTEGQ